MPAISSRVSSVSSFERRSTSQFHPFLILFVVSLLCLIVVSRQQDIQREPLDWIWEYISGGLNDFKYLKLKWLEIRDEQFWLILGVSQLTWTPFFSFLLGSHLCRQGMVGSRTTLEAQHIFPWSAAEFEGTGRGHGFLGRCRDDEMGECCEKNSSMGMQLATWGYI